MNRIDILGYAASATVLATFCMTTMLHLRLLAIVSNILFICFGALAHIHPVLVLHLILLPVNLARLIQIGKRLSAYRGLSCTNSGLAVGQRLQRSPLREEDPKLWSKPKKAQSGSMFSAQPAKPNIG